ncbi:hypothetical protein L249_6583 [Ophiocordyceps polyrhachis-furcata BCC 54312]|uniref:DUF4045 domain-containing protein n=1 Tax=Ophiocordyceps polyrhachis-furcata BCC 54312 TaxID=1330021 RepID=A0A367LJG0_9HYPO|nr:hypothetical protein L249_6583 [Ophiocordyceps polyrhachis-furcata BCC 54312]
MSDEVSQFLEQVELLRGQQAEEGETRARELEDFLAAKRERQARREERARSISPQKSSPVNTPSPRSSRRAGHQSPTSLGDKHLDLSAPQSAMEPLGSPTKENEAPLDSAEAKRLSTADARSSTLSWQRRPTSRPLSMVAAQNATQRSLAAAHDPSDQTAAGPRQTADVARRGHDDDNTAYVTSPTHDARLGSPVTLKPSQQEPPADDKPPSEQQGVTSPPTGRTSPIRSTSPTKGVGGFVQSAMMKRNDSVKRWSVTSPPGLTRADSVAANRNSHERTNSRPHSTHRNHSPAPGSSRPTSSQGEDDLGQDATVTSTDTDHATKPDDDATIPTSPTRTMDTRRWSPTKSSWLESALNRPESPTKTQPKPKPQPAWMVELNKARAERANSQGTDASRPVTHKHQVSIGGLMRQSPVGEVAKTNPTGLGGIYSPPSTTAPSFTPRGHEAKPSIAESIISEGASETDGSTAAASDTRRPSIVKPKPEPKDFRAGLRQRPAPADAPKSGESELKNVFGNLRRTKTQNYVAPDQLKDNILRGKAALNTTDGPRKTERRDDFKEAILKKREDFKKAQAEGKGVTRSSLGDGGKQPLEGVAKRFELRRSTTGSSTGSTTGSRKGSVVAESTSPKDEAQRSPTALEPATAESPTVTSPPPPSFDKARLEQPTPKDAAGPEAPSSTQARVGGGGGGGNKLAGRLNPALAGMLARGPPPMASTNGGGQGSDESAAGDGSEPTAPGPQLSHMTKSRARGPKRKAPTSSPAPATPAATSGGSEARGAPERATESGEQGRDGPEEKPTSDKPAAAPLSIQQQVAAQAALRNRGAAGKPEAKAAESVKQTSSAAKDEESHVAPTETNGDGKDAGRKVDVKQASRLFDDEKPASVTPPVHRRSGSQSPTKKPLTESEAKGEMKGGNEDGGRKVDVKQASRLFDEKPASVKEATPPFHRRTGSQSPTKQQQQPKDMLETVSKSNGSRPSTPKAKSKGATLALSGDALKSPSVTTSPVRSPSKVASEVSRLLTDFFGPPCPRKEMRVDAAEMLMSRPAGGGSSGKLTSLGFQMFRIFGDGKKIPVSAQNERVLFEQDMYVCAHNFTNEAGKKMFEVYFWVGDEVPQATAEDAQLFVQREAKSLGGKLVRLRQGQESAEFLAALGGVVIVRRGTSNKYDSLAPNMLCGRRYLGQVAFDEVDFSPSSLCSGFSYLLAQSGKCFLWKGKGSDVAEVSCARLVGIDLSLTGELIECDDGDEPASFWDMFDAESPKPVSAAHWRLKPSYDKYRSRLFCSDADSEQQVSFTLRIANEQQHQNSSKQMYEITPFVQTDLSPSHIYVLDAFFELYVVVGAQAKAQYGSFRNALDFAQEYAILAAGIEDRPFVPVSSVVLEGAPRDLKRVFRKWHDRNGPTAAAAAATTAAATTEGGNHAGLKRGRSLRVVTLTQALQAMSE